MATFNSGQFLEEAIRSVLNQTMRDLELIVVDNLSDDNTLEIVNRIKAIDDRVKWVELSDRKKFPFALRKGLELARGDWIAIADSDDVLEPDKFRLQLDCVSANPGVVFVGTDAIIIDRYGNERSRHSYPADSQELKSRLTHVRAFPPHSSSLFSRRAAESVGGYDVKMLSAEDYDFFLRLSSSGNFCSVREPMVRIRKHESNLSAAENSDRAFQYIVASQVSEALRKAGTKPPADSDDRAWFEFLEWLSLNNEFKKASREYVSICKLIERKTEAAGLTARLLLALQSMRHVIGYGKFGMPNFPKLTRTLMQKWRERENYLARAL